MKLSPIVWVWVGIAILIVAVSYGWFFNAGPNYQEANWMREAAAKYKDEGAKLNAAKKRCADAEAEVKRVGAEWNAIVEEHTPPMDVNSGGISLAVDRLHLTVEARKFRDSVQAAVNRQVKMGGVHVVQGPTIPDPPTEPDQIVQSYFNYPGFKFPACVFDLGTVTVTGTWEQIKANIKSWSAMPEYLAVADGLAVNGTSPLLTATYNVTLVAYVRGQKVAPPVGAGTAAAAPAAGAAASGGTNLPSGFRQPGVPPASPPAGGRGGGGRPGDDE